jgi:hypothetical protein
VLDLPYVETDAPIRREDDRTYAGEGVVAQPVAYEWNHGLGEIVQAVIDAGLRITRLEEHRSVEWPALPGMVEVDHGRYALPERPERLPLMYTLQAVRDGERGAGA